MRKESILCDNCKQEMEKRYFEIRVVQYDEGSSDGGVIIEKEVCSPKCLKESIVI